MKAAIDGKRNKSQVRRSAGRVESDVRWSRGTIMVNSSGQTDAMRETLSSLMDGQTERGT